ncbi:MAG: hypothetical protein JO345_11455 [Streptosporangiaceae bacterium]|nr:hypothetical protein [Streptosporangiaceae bacterium]
MSVDGARRPMPGEAVRIMLRPVASSLPLGFFAFGAGTMLLTALELHWAPLTDSRQLMVIVLAFVVPLELLAGLFAFLARDHGAATGLCIFAAVWAATALTEIGGPPGSLSLPLAIFLLTLVPMMLAMSVASIPGKPAFGVLMLFAASRFALTGVYQATGVKATETAAGWLGVPIGVFALYGGLALLLEESFRRTVLPLGRRGVARTSLEGEFGHQILGTEQEPGIRRQL